MLVAPGRKFGDGPGIGLACVRVTDVRGKELDKLLGCMRGWSKEGGERSCAGNGELCFVFHGCPLPKRHV